MAIKCRWYWSWVIMSEMMIIEVKHQLTQLIKMCALLAYSLHTVITSISILKWRMVPVSLIRLDQLDTALLTCHYWLIDWLALSNKLSPSNTDSIQSLWLVSPRAASWRYYYSYLSICNCKSIASIAAILSYFAYFAKVQFCLAV